MAWADEEHNAIVKMLAIVCEVTATEMSDGARRFILEKLKEYRAPTVMNALKQCAGTCKFKLTLAEIIERIEASRSRVPTAAETRKMLDERDALWRANRLGGVEGMRQLVAKQIKDLEEKS